MKVDANTKMFPLRSRLMNTHFGGEAGHGNTFKIVGYVRDPACEDRYVVEIEDGTRKEAFFDELFDTFHPIDVPQVPPRHE